eukprot:jgi/Picsp_1/211/NSC_00210-R1_protein
MRLLAGKNDRARYQGSLRKPAPVATRSSNSCKEWRRPVGPSRHRASNQIGNDGGGPRRSRLIPLVLSIPQRLDRYFEQYPIRRGVWCVISAGAGFYAGNIATLSFGALAINDVFAAIVTLLFYEIVSNLFYGAKRPSLKLWFANFFKIGMTASMLADAVKLGG